MSFARLMKEFVATVHTSSTRAQDIKITILLANTQERCTLVCKEIRQVSVFLYHPGTVLSKINCCIQPLTICQMGS